MENPAYYRPTLAKVNLKAIRQNIKSLQKHLEGETAVIAVVKADGYGHGQAEVAKTAFEAGAVMVAVATPDEAVKLRAEGINGEILVMGPSPFSFVEEAAALGITITVADGHWLHAAHDIAKSWRGRVKVHVKIDCGMGRIGIRDEKGLSNLLSAAEQSNRFHVDGAFTHFSCADQADPKETEKQFEKFMEFVRLFPEKPRVIHASNSAAALLYPQYGLDAVRFGISMYGVSPSEYVQDHLLFPLEKALELESELAFVKRVKEKETISYGATYTASEDEWIGTIPIGYADGLRRGLRGQEVLIDGKRMPIVGTICMDQCMVKLPREYPAGEKVVLIGRQGNEEITAEEWAKRLDTIAYEVLVSISKRVPRIY